MKTVQCPYCSVNFGAVGFRPVAFKCIQCGADAEWYSGSVYGERRGLIAWDSNDSTESYLYDMYMGSIMQEIEQLESETQTYFSKLKTDAQAVSNEIMEAIAMLTEMLGVLYEEYAVLVVIDPAAAAEVMAEIEEVLRKIDQNESLMLRIELVIGEIDALEQEFMSDASQLNEDAEDSFYGTIDDITSSNQADLSSDGGVFEYSSEEEWQDLTQRLTQSVNDTLKQVQNVYQQKSEEIRQIESEIQF